MDAKYFLVQGLPKHTYPNWDFWNADTKPFGNPEWRRQRASPNNLEHRRLEQKLQSRLSHMVDYF
jgi:hypothetical protein